MESSRRTWRWFLPGAMIAAFICIGILVGIVLFIARALGATSSSNQPVRIAMEPGTSPKMLAMKLEEAGLIRSGSVFTAYLRWKQEGSRFQAGVYEWVPGVSLDGIISDLNVGKTVKAERLRITIPEGFTVVQIANRIAEFKGTDTGQVLEMINTISDWNSVSTASIPALPGIKYRLEGYLFPETYELGKDATVREIVQKMVTELDKRLAQLPIGWEDKLKERGLTLHQMLTMASLVEREAALKEERPLIASVIYNRLNKRMPLQIDATIQYLFEKPKDRLVEKDLQIVSPYNTYLISGLPPGPIASPSLSSMQAVIEPAQTNYLFYVTKKDGSRAHLFASTFEQHILNNEGSKQKR